MFNQGVASLLVLSMLLTACSSVKSEDLVGQYIAYYPFGTERVTLNADGTYSQDIRLKLNNQRLDHIGRWRYSAEDTYVELEDALDVADRSEERRVGKECRSRWS